MSTYVQFEFFEEEEDTVSVSLSRPDGTSVDLTGLTIDYKVWDGSTSVLSKSDGSGITVTNASGGELEIQFSGSDLALDPGLYTHEMRLTGTEYKETVLTGSVEIYDSRFV